MNKKLFATIGMIVSAIVILMGLLAMTGALGGDANYPSGASYLYDTGYASFGGDFYSYVNNNAAEAASAAATTANNVRKLCELLSTVSGIFLMGFGAMGLCFFGIQFCGCGCGCGKKEEQAVPAAPEAVEEPQVNAEPEVPVNAE